MYLKCVAKPPHNADNTQPYAPVAQLDRVPGYEPGGQTFESSRARQILKLYQAVTELSGDRFAFKHNQCRTFAGLFSTHAIYCLN